MSSCKSNSQKSRLVAAGIDSGLSIFKPRQVETGIENEIKVDFYPLASIQRHKCIEFLIPESNALYFALNKTVLRIKMKVINTDGEDPTDGEKVGLVNAPGISLFRQVDVQLQQKMVSSDIGTHYPYKGMLDNLVFTPDEFLLTGGRKFLYVKDSPHSMDKIDLAPQGSNEGLLVRYQYSKKGNEILLEVPIYNDLFQIDEFLPCNMELKIRLWPNNDSFVLMANQPAESYMYKIEECILRMRGYEINKTVLDAHNSLLTKTNAIFDYQRSVLKSYNIPAHTPSWNIHQFLQGEIPSQLLVTFVDGASSVGDLKLNPYNFDTFGLQYISLEVEGYQARVFKPNFENKHWVDEYSALIEPDHGQIFSHTPPIRMEDFGGGYAIYKFRLGNEQIERANRKKHGLSRLVINFKDPLAKAVTCIVYAKFFSHFEIDIARNVYFENECNW